MSENELEFAIFCVESVADFLKKDSAQIYKALVSDSDILHSYIIPEYEVLHTQGKEYIVNDIMEVVRERGVMLA